MSSHVDQLITALEDLLRITAPDTINASAAMGRARKTLDSIKLDHGSHNCGDCGCAEGELHDLGCDMERCPKCGGQLISCDCAYDFLFPNRDKSAPLKGLPVDVYEKGIPSHLWVKWLAELDRIGRVPWIRYPNVCARCGELYPDLFMVPDKEWRHYIPIGERDKILCRPCYDHIRQLIDRAKQRRKAQ